MATSIKETALGMALTATRDLIQLDGAATVNVAKQFEEYLSEPSGEQAVIERDEARARVVALERELASTVRELGTARRHALQAVLTQAREGCEGLDLLLVEATVETAAKTIGVAL